VSRCWHSECLCCRWRGMHDGSGRLLAPRYLEHYRRGRLVDRHAFIYSPIRNHAAERLARICCVWPGSQPVCHCRQCLGQSRWTHFITTRKRAMRAQQLLVRSTYTGVILFGFDWWTQVGPMAACMHSPQSPAPRHERGPSANLDGSLSALVDARFQSGGDWQGWCGGCMALLAVRQLVGMRQYLATLLRNRGSGSGG
jgi:hypothetical protein